MTSETTRKILLFVFYGLYDHKYSRKIKHSSKKVMVIKKKPVLDWIHRKTINNGRTRFTAKVNMYFKKFIKLFEKKQNNAKYRELLIDGGKGEAPTEYLIAVEDGLRAHRTSVHTMGTRPLRYPPIFIIPLS